MTDTVTFTSPITGLQYATEFYRLDQLSSHRDWKDRIITILRVAIYDRKNSESYVGIGIKNPADEDNVAEGLNAALNYLRPVIPSEDFYWFSSRVFRSVLGAR